MISEKNAIDYSELDKQTGYIPLTISHCFHFFDIISMFTKKPNSERYDDPQRN